MTEPDNTAPPSDDPVVEVPELRLRSAPPRVVRLSPKAVAVLGAVAAFTIGGALVYALHNRAADKREELYATAASPGNDRLAGAPRDYSQTPRLGPPLPGDLGRPILDAQRRGVPAPSPMTGAHTPSSDPVDAERQRIQQEIEAARVSRIFFGDGGRAAPAAAASSADAATRRDLLAAAPAPLPAFLDRPSDLRTTSVHRLEPPVSPFVLQAGSVIPAALITGIRSDLPGQVTAQVTQSVYDSLTGRVLLIPQGARLVGTYDSGVAFGQQRVLLAWERLILPDGRSIVLERQPAADPAGYAGLEDDVDHHWGNVLRAALISTLLGVGAELAANGDDPFVRAVRAGAQGSVNQSGQQVVRRELDVRPTLTIRPGYPVRVMVTRDLVLEPAGK